MISLRGSVARRTKLSRRVMIALIGLSAVFPLGCGTTPNNPGPLLLSTEPSGALVFIEGEGLKLTTPCSLPSAVDTDDALRVIKPGFVEWSGCMEDLPQIAANHYQLILTPNP